MKEFEVYEVPLSERLVNKLNNFIEGRSYWLLVYYASMALFTTYLQPQTFAMLFVALDQLLTHYQLWKHHRKTGDWDMGAEANFIPRLIMKIGTGHPSPLNFMIGCLIVAPLILIIVSSGIAVGTQESLIATGVIIGFFIVVNIYHVMQINKEDKK